MKKRIKILKSLLLENTNRGKLARLVLFFLLYFLGRYLILSPYIQIILEPVFNSLYPFLSMTITDISSGVLHWFYPDIYTSKDYIIYINNNPILQMQPGCTGLQQMLRLTFTIIFYPLAWRSKCFLWPISIAIILIAAILHFTLLVPIAYVAQSWYNFAHDWVTKIIFYGMYFICYLIWEHNRK